MGFKTLSLDASNDSVLKPMDIFEMEGVSDPQISPDGSKILYVRSGSDIMKDKRYSNIWIINFDGSDNRPITSGKNGNSQPRWSPDGKLTIWRPTRLTVTIFPTGDWTIIATIKVNYPNV